MHDRHIQDTALNVKLLEHEAESVCSRNYSGISGYVRLAII